MTFVNQANKPNYQSSLIPLAYVSKKGHIDSSVRDLERQRNHENFISGAYRDLSEITERKFINPPVLYDRAHSNQIVDFEQPRAMWSKVWNDAQREAYVRNVSGHLGNVKSTVVKDRQCEFTNIYPFRVTL
jgi:catalase